MMKASKALTYTLLLLLLLLITFSLTACSKPGVEYGDTVSVLYTGFLADGTVFDTNIAEVAVANNMYDPAREYAPLNVTIGDGQVIVGFENALLGMSVGDEKTVTIPPEEAYGPHYKGKVLSTRLIRDAPRVVTIQWSGNESLSVGQEVKIEDTFWPSTVLSFNDSSVTVRQDPSEGLVAKTPLGPATVTIIKEDGEELVHTKLLLEVGAIIQHQAGIGRVVAVNESHASIDYNHPLAGESLVFELRLVGLEKAVKE